MNKFEKEIAPLPKTTKFLKRILKDQICAATDGQSLICDQGKLFPGSIGNDFKNQDWNKPGPATVPVKFSVYELTKNGNGASIFNSFNRSLSELTFTPPQIIEMVKNNSSILHPEGGSTVFLIEINGNYFQVHVKFGSDSRKVSVYPIGYDVKWFTVYSSRFVIPQHEPVKQ